MFRKPKKRPKEVLRTLRVGNEDDDDMGNKDVSNSNTLNMDDQQQQQHQQQRDEEEEDDNDEFASPLLLAKRFKGGRRLNNSSRTSATSNPTNLLQQPRQQQRILYQHYHMVDDNNDLQGHESIPMRLKTSGIGYGGGHTSTTTTKNLHEQGVDDLEDFAVDKGCSAGGGCDDEGVVDTSTVTTGCYDTESLSRLQAEQQYYKQQQNSNTDSMFPEHLPRDATTTTPTTLTGLYQYSDLRQQQQAHGVDEDEDPWDAAVATVVAGVVDPVDEGEDDDENDAEWRQEPPDRSILEDTDSTSSPKAFHHPNLLPPEERANKKLLSLQQLKESLTTTLTHITHQNHDHTLRWQQMQQQVQQHTRDDLERQESQLRETGKAVEYYQQLRQKLVDWVGALRQLQEKVIPIQRALHELEAEMAANRRRRDWEIDMIAVLYQHNRLDKVLGNQPDDPKSLFDPLQTIQVDEFGRDVQSQCTMQREQRAKKRHRIQKQRAPQGRVRGDESDAYLSDDEKETYRERHDALQKALEVAVQELDEEFTGLQNLVDVFETWRRDFPDDYKQCYASLSLADLASVLILTELCALNDPWNESGGYNEGKWIAVVKSAVDLGILQDSGVERILEKSVYPSFSDLLHRSGYSLVSTRQARALSSFIKHVMKIAPPDSPNLGKLRRKVEGYIEKSLLEISIPIIRSSAHHARSSEELQEVIEGATVGQMHTLQKILLNIITYWGPLLGGQDGSLAFAEVVLDFISNKFLFLLSSLQQDVSDSRFSESPADLFREVWDALLSTGWLNDPKFMLQTVAIRAAFSAYTISNC